MGFTLLVTTPKTHPIEVEDFLKFYFTQSTSYGDSLSEMSLSGAGPARSPIVCYKKLLLGRFDHCLRVYLLKA